MARCKSILKSRGKGLCGQKTSILDTIGRGRNRYSSTGPKAHNLQSSKPFKLAKNYKELKQEYANTDQATKDALKKVAIAAGSKISGGLARVAERKLLLPNPKHGKVHGVVRSGVRSAVIGLLNFFGEQENLSSSAKRASNAYNKVQQMIEDKKSSSEPPKKLETNTAYSSTPVDRKIFQAAEPDVDREAAFQKMMAQGNKPDPENERRYQEMLKLGGRGMKKPRMVAHKLANKLTAKLLHKIAHNFPRKRLGRNKIYAKHR